MDRRFCFLVLVVKLINKAKNKSILKAKIVCRPLTFFRGKITVTFKHNVYANGRLVGAKHNQKFEKQL